MKILRLFDLGARLSRYSKNAIGMQLSKNEEIMTE